MLKQRVENLSQLSEKLEEKHGQIIGLENRVQRMENVSPRFIPTVLYQGVWNDVVRSLARRVGVCTVLQNSAFPLRHFMGPAR